MATFSTASSSTIALFSCANFSDAAAIFASCACKFFLSTDKSLTLCSRTALSLNDEASCCFISLSVSSLTLPTTTAVLCSAFALSIFNLLVNSSVLRASLSITETSSFSSSSAVATSTAISFFNLSTSASVLLQFNAMESFSLFTLLKFKFISTLSPFNSEFILSKFEFSSTSSKDSLSTFSSFNLSESMTLFKLLNSALLDAAWVWQALLLTASSSNCAIRASESWFVLSAVSTLLAIAAFSFISESTKSERRHSSSDRDARPRWRRLLGMISAAASLFSSFPASTNALRHSYFMRHSPLLPPP